MDDDTVRWPTLTERHIKRVDDQLGTQMIGHLLIFAENQQRTIRTPKEEAPFLEVLSEIEIGAAI